jgi:ADP-ribosylglycohydrolase
MMGFVVGDALGVPVQFMTLIPVKNKRMLTLEVKMRYNHNNESEN